MKPQGERLASNPILVAVDVFGRVYSRTPELDRMRTKLEQTAWKSEWKHDLCRKTS